MDYTLMDLVDALEYIGFVINSPNKWEIASVLISAFGLFLTVVINLKTQKEVSNNNKEILNDKKYERRRCEVLKTYSLYCSSLDVFEPGGYKNFILREGGSISISEIKRCN